MNTDALRNDAVFIAIFGEEGLVDMDDEAFLDYLKPKNDDLKIESLDWDWARKQVGITA